MATIRLFNNHLRLKFLMLASLEALTFLVSVYSAALVRFQETEFEYTNIVIDYNGGDIGIIASIYTFVMMLCMVAIGHYQSQQHFSPSMFTETIIKVLVSLTLGSISLMIIFYMIPDVHMGRGYKIAGYIAVQNEIVAVPESKVITVPAEDISQYALDNEVDEIILAIEDRRKSYHNDALIKCKLAGIKIVDPVCFLEREQGKLNLEMLHPSWMIYSNGFDRSDLKRFSARLFDIVTSSIILLVMTPVMILTAFLISLESGFKHSVLYRQSRVGLDDVPFTLLKFRSMKINAESDGKAVWAKKNDERITFFGHFIRKTRIDELPQIINIFKGDMRLVGPRPERPEFVDQLATKIPYYKKRHTVKPGLAGWAQLKYPYGATEEDAYEKLQYDLYYVKNHNVIMDFFILLQTIEIVIMGKGAR